MLAAAGGVGIAATQIAKGAGTIIHSFRFTPHLLLHTPLHTQRSALALSLRRLQTNSRSHAWRAVRMSLSTIRMMAGRNT